MHRSIAPGLVVLLSLGCGASTPLGYTGGVRWTVPLVAPLENRELLLPVTIHGKGPYLFVVDPDAPRSMIDRGVARELDLYTESYDWWNFLDHTDHQVRRRRYEVLDFKAGDLHIRHVTMFAVPAGSLRVGDRQVHGVLGGDLLSRTIVLDVDRDQGVLRLALTGHEERPVQPATKGYTSKANGPFRKLVVPVTLEDGSTVELAIDFAAKTSAMRNDLFERAGWPRADHEEEVIDEYGTRQVVDGIFVAPSLRVDKVIAQGIAMIPFADKRVFYFGFDGVLGQNLLSRYRVIFQPDRRELWLLPREPDLLRVLDSRLARWGNTFSRCQDSGCVSVEYNAETGLRVRRTRGAPATGFTVSLQATDAQGQPLDAPLIRVAMSRAEVVASPSQFGENFAGIAAFRVVDASPHAGPCSTVGCVALIGHWQLPLARPTLSASRENPQ